MAGEIQLNSTTALTEDTGAITLNNVNSATNRTNLGLGSIATQASGSIDIDGGAIDGVTIGTNSAATDVRVDNLKLDGNTISATNTDGNIVLDPNGTGNVLIGNFTLDADQTVGAGQDNMVLTYDYAQGTIGLEAAASSGTIASQDSDAVAITGGSITGTEFDLKSTGTSVYKSDGTTAVISESGGTVTVNNSTLGSSTIFPAGHVLQVKQTLKTDFYSNTTQYSSWSDITGLSVSITPSSTSSKILVVAHLTGTANTSGMWIIGRVLRGTTAIGIGDSRGSSARAGFGWRHAVAGADDNSGVESASTMILDAPSTTSATTYKVQACNGNDTVSGTWTINGTVTSAYTYNSSSVSSITVMEIAG